jgi:hypothetical protein
MPEWKFVLDEQPFEFFRTTRGSDRRVLLQAFEQLRAHPTREGRWRSKDDHARDLQVELFGRFLIAYWDDFVVKELRIVQISRLQRGG